MEPHADDTGTYSPPPADSGVIRVFIRTSEHVIIGSIHTSPDQWLKDVIDANRTSFLTIIDAHVYSASEETLIYHSAQMLVAAAHIVLISPLSDHIFIRDVPWLADRPIPQIPL